MIGIVGGLLNIGLFFILLKLLFKRRLPMGANISISFLLSVAFFCLFAENFMDNISRHGIAAIILYLLLKSRILKVNNFEKEEEEQRRH